MLRPSLPSPAPSAARCGHCCPPRPAPQGTEGVVGTGDTYRSSYFANLLTTLARSGLSRIFFLSSLWISVSFRIQLLAVLEWATYRLTSCLKHLAMFLHPSMLHRFFLPSFPSRQLTEPTVVGAAPPCRPALWGKSEVLFPRPRGRYA